MKPLKEVTMKCTRCRRETRVKTSIYMRMQPQERDNFRCNYCIRFSESMEEAETSSR